MRRIFVYFISLLLLIISGFGQIFAQDTLLIPLKIKVGFEVSGPAIYYIEKKNLNAEAYLAVDLNEKIAAYLGAGYLNYKYSQYNYSYLNNGIFIRTGAEVNLLKPEKSMGRYWVGIGLHYGLSVYNSEYPSFQKDNYWGTESSSIAKATDWGHFIEAAPGVRAEIFKNFNIGWTISLRMLLYTSGGNNVRPIYFPGFGNGTKTFSAGLNYFIVWNITYKKKTVITKKEEPEEETDDTAQPSTQKSTIIRQ